MTAMWQTQDTRVGAAAPLVEEREQVLAEFKGEAKKRTGSTLFIDRRH